MGAESHKQRIWRPRGGKRLGLSVREFSVAITHCASGEFYDMGWEKGKSQNFHLACSSVGAKKIIPRHYDSGFEKQFIEVKGERIKKFFIPICVRRSELVSFTLFTFCSLCAGKYFNNQLSGKIFVCT